MCPILHFCIFRESIKCLDVLLQNKNINLEIRDSENRTPLLYSIIIFNLEIIKKIILAGADLNSKGLPLFRLVGKIITKINLDKMGYIKYENSYINSCFEIVKLLLNYGVDPELFKTMQHPDVEARLIKIYNDHKNQIYDKIKQVDVLPKVLNNIVHEYLFEKELNL